MATIVTVKVHKDGRCTIPKNAREIEGIKEGDYAVLHVGKAQSVEAKQSRSKQE